jgi:hypothetical protein
MAMGFHSGNSLHRRSHRGRQLQEVLSEIVAMAYYRGAGRCGQEPSPVPVPARRQTLSSVCAGAH